MPRERFENNKTPRYVQSTFFPPFEKKPKISWFSIEGIGGFHSGGKRKCNDFDSEEKELKRKKMDYMRLLFSPMKWLIECIFLQNKTTA